MVVKISHESPLELLEFSRTYNDYDYALVHLFDKYPQYLKFFKDSLSQGRSVYLDNSYFELGHPYDESKYVKYINELGSINPTNFYYVLPDSESKIEILDFISSHSLPGNRIGVAHGDTPGAMIESIRFLRDFCDVVALPYINGDLDRTDLILNYLEPAHALDGIKLHLLGCRYPQEFRAYVGRNWFFSLDTSNPVLHGILRIRYGDVGLDTKNKTLMADVMEAHITEAMLDDVKYNVKKFKELLNV